ncbi:hypothetical protein K7H20_13910 [Salipiger manganoxidans]|uniref:hypothetical protein n=1 Tax=Salipiger marinus TaxID=555512 RepID=UPI001E628D11|nr:hypothetical protein [Salipiger manganoxidans]MCD1619161.1 hypothetical protein [Salipiger manganoxidans]
MRLVMSTLIQEIDAFLAETGLSEHRAGIILASNGRLIPRLRDGGRVWPETEEAVRGAIARERQARLSSGTSSPASRIEAAE